MDEKENQKQCLGCFAWYGESYHVCPHCGYVEGTPVEEPLHMMPGTRLRDRYIIGKVLGFGGFGESGMGSYHGIDGFRTFSHYKSIVDKKTWIDLPMRYQKYRKIYEKMVRMFMR